MAVTLIVEDGTGVTNANTFATVAQARLYATNRGVSLASDDPAGDNLVAIMLIKAMDYIRAKCFSGKPVDYLQSLPYPRTGVYLNPNDWCEEYPDDEIPSILVEAQCSVVLQIKNGVDVMPTIVAGSFITREKVGPLETEYSDKIGIYSIPQMPVVDALLMPLLCNSGGFSLRTVRV